MVWILGSPDYYTFLRTHCRFSPLHSFSRCRLLGLFVHTTPSLVWDVLSLCCVASNTLGCLWFSRTAYHCMHFTTTGSMHYPLITFRWVPVLDGSVAFSQILGYFSGSGFWVLHCGSHARYWDHTQDHHADFTTTRFTHHTPLPHTHTGSHTFGFLHLHTLPFHGYTPAWVVSRHTTTPAFPVRSWIHHHTTWMPRLFGYVCGLTPCTPLHARFRTTRFTVGLHFLTTWVVTPGSRLRSYYFSRTTTFLHGLPSGLHTCILHRTLVWVLSTTFTVHTHTRFGLPVQFGSLRGFHVHGSGSYSPRGTTPFCTWFTPHLPPAHGPAHDSGFTTLWVQLLRTLGYTPFLPRSLRLHTFTTPTLRSSHISFTRLDGFGYTTARLPHIYTTLRLGSSHTVRLVGSHLQFTVTYTCPHTCHIPRSHTVPGSTHTDLWFPLRVTARSTHTLHPWFLLHGWFPTRSTRYTQFTTHHYTHHHTSAHIHHYTFTPRTPHTFYAILQFLGLRSRSLDSTTSLGYSRSFRFTPHFGFCTLRLPFTFLHCVPPRFTFRFTTYHISHLFWLGYLTLHWMHLLHTLDACSSHTCTAHTTLPTPPFFFFLVWFTWSHLGSFTLSRLPLPHSHVLLLRTWVGSPAWVPHRTPATLHISHTLPLPLHTPLTILRFTTHSPAGCILLVWSHVHPHTRSWISFYFSRFIHHVYGYTSTFARTTHTHGLHTAVGLLDAVWLRFSSGSGFTPHRTFTFMGSTPPTHVRISFLVFVPGPHWIRSGSFTFSLGSFHHTGPRTFTFTFHGCFLSHTFLGSRHCVSLRSRSCTVLHTHLRYLHTFTGWFTHCLDHYGWILRSRSLRFYRSSHLHCLRTPLFCHPAPSHRCLSVTRSGPHTTLSWVHTVHGCTILHTTVVWFTHTLHCHHALYVCLVYCLQSHLPHLGLDAFTLQFTRFAVHLATPHGLLVHGPHTTFSLDTRSPAPGSHTRFTFTFSRSGSRSPTHLPGSTFLPAPRSHTTFTVWIYGSAHVCLVTTFWILVYHWFGCLVHTPTCTYTAHTAAGSTPTVTPRCTHTGSAHHTGSWFYTPVRLYYRLVYRFGYTFGIARTGPVLRFHTYHTRSFHYWARTRPARHCHAVTFTWVCRTPARAHTALLSVRLHGSRSAPFTAFTLRFTPHHHGSGWFGFHAHHYLHAHAHAPAPAWFVTTAPALHTFSAGPPLHCLSPAPFVMGSFTTTVPHGFWVPHLGSHCRTYYWFTFLVPLGFGSGLDSSLCLHLLLPTGPAIPFLDRHTTLHSLTWLFLPGTTVHHTHTTPTGSTSLPRLHIHTYHVLPHTPFCSSAFPKFCI